MEISLSDAEKAFIIHGVEEGCRTDGRSANDYRPISLETAILPTTSGSARVRLGSSDLLVGVKAELSRIDDVKKHRNRLRFSVDCSANATPLFEGKGGQEMADSIASALDAAYDNEYVLPDLSKLIISPMHAWTIFVDIVVLECGGNILDAASIGVVKAALSTTEICHVRTRPADGGRVEVELSEQIETWTFDVTRIPLIVGVNKIGCANVFDATLTEEACCKCSLWVAVVPPLPTANGEMDTKTATDEDCRVTFVRQTGRGSLDPESVDEMLRSAVSTVQNLDRVLHQRLAEERQTFRDALTAPTTFLL